MAALGVAIVALGGFLLAWSGSRSSNRPPSQQNRSALESDALRQLALPSSFVRFTHGCSSGRCYGIDAPAAQVASEMPGLLRKAGFERPGRLRLAEPVAMLKASHWSTASADPLVIACKTTQTASKGALRVCQDAGRTGDTLVNILVRPYQPCKSLACADPRRAEVLAWAVAYPTTG